MQCWCLVTHCDNNRACTKARYTLSTTEVIFQDFPSMENTTFKDFEKISGRSCNAVLVSGDPL